MKFYYQKELDNLSNSTIEAIEDYTRDTQTDTFFYEKVKEFEDLRNDTDKVNYLEDLAIDLELKEFNLTDVQEIIISYMFITDLFTKDYADEILELLDKTLL